MADIAITPDSGAAEQDAPVTFTDRVEYTYSDAPIQPPVSLQQLMQVAQQLADRVADLNSRLESAVDALDSRVTALENE